MYLTDKNELIFSEMLFVIKFILLIILINNCNCSIIPDGKGIYKINKEYGISGVFLTRII